MSKMKKTIEQVTDLLKSYDIMPTQQRLKIANILCAEPCHMSADQVLTKVNQDADKADKKVCKATVYNTLGIFAGKGLIREVIVDSSRLFYDSNTSQHHHFYNVDTGKLMDIMDKDFFVSDSPVLPQGTVNDGMEVVVRLRNK